MRLAMWEGISSESVIVDSILTDPTVEKEYSFPSTNLEGGFGIFATCGTHNSAVQGTANGTINATNYGTYDNSVNSAIYGTHLVAHDDTFNSGVRSTVYITRHNTQNSSVNSGHNVTVK